MKRLGVLALVCLFASAATAAPLDLQGPAVQGGLIVGHAAPGSRVWQDGKRVRLAPDGRFLLALAHDAGPVSRIKVAPPAGPAATVTLTIEARKFPVQRIEGLPEAQVSPDAKTLKRIRSEHARIVEIQHARTQTPMFDHPFRWPVTGIISGVYGSARILNGEPRAPHLGVDIAADAGTPIVAPTDGVVVLVANLFFTGNTVMLDHGYGLTSIYAHLSRVDVAPGEHVAPGTVLGLMGQTGRATGPNLHWGVDLNGVAVDPALLAGPMPQARAAP